jgi:hypothetical protein
VQGHEEMQVSEVAMALPKNLICPYPVQGHEET